MLKKAIFQNNISVGGSGRPTIDAIRAVAQAEPEAFVQKMQNEINAGKITLQNVRLQDMFHALADIEVKAHMEVAGRERAIMAGAFPLLTGGLMVNAMNNAYQAVPTIGQDLVTELEDNKKVTTIAGVNALDKSVDTVAEGDPFPEISAAEEKVEIRSKRNGRMLTISAEAIEENELADIVTRVNALGEIAADWVEEQTLERIADKTGSNTSSAAAPYVYRPNGSGTALYSATANTPGTRAPSGTRKASNALVDETDLEAARVVLAAMKNSRGKRLSIPMSGCTLLVPDALASVAATLLNSEFVPGNVNELNQWGTRGQYRPRLLSSPKLDDISTTAWYLGDFRRQFIRKWKLRFEYVTLAGTTKDFLDRRIAFQARIAWDVEVGATDYVYVVQSLAGTTYTP